METVFQFWFIVVVILVVVADVVCKVKGSASVALTSSGNRQPRNLLRQDFQPSDLEFSPRWKFNMSYLPKLYMKLQHESLTLKCEARGRPKPNITWFHNGHQIDFSSSSSSTSSHKYEVYSFSLKILDLMSAYDNGNYTCVVGNRHGSLSHTYIVDVVVRYVGAPQFTSGPKNQTVFEGEMIHMTCSYYSDMEAFVYWRKHFAVNGSYVTKDGKTHATLLQRSDENGPDDTEWIIQKATLSDSGLYSCCATNVYNTSCRQAWIQVTPGHRKNFTLSTKETENSLTTIVLPVVIACCPVVLVVCLSLICLFRRRNYRKIMFKDPDVVNPIYLNLPPTELSKNFQIPFDEKWVIPGEDLRLGPLIGEGAFGLVYMGHLMSQVTKSKQQSSKQTTVVAVKTLRDGETEEDLRRFLKEIEMMTGIGNHINIIGFLGCSIQNGRLLVVVEFAEYGNLRDFLRERRTVDQPVNRTIPLTLDDVIAGRCSPPYATLVSFAFQTARGLEYLASKSVVHRDVACRNVLLAENLVVKIADFGLTRVVEGYTPYYRKHSTDLLPIRWMSPESLIDNVYTTKSDVWSFGVLLWEIFTLGDVPFQSIPIENLHSQLKSGLRLPKPNSATTEIYQTMIECWQYLPSNRPNFSELVSRIEACLSRVTAADYLLLEDKAENSGSDEDVFDTNAVRYPGREDRVLSMTRSGDSQYSSWSSDHTSNEAAQTHLLPNSGKNPER